MLRVAIYSFVLLALLSGCDRSSGVQKKDTAVVNAASAEQKVAQNDANDQLIIDNDVDEPTGDAIDKAEHDDEVEVDMD